MEKISKKRILELAYFSALENWAAEEKIHKEVGNEISHRRVNKAWDEVQQISQLLLEEENK